MSKASASLNIVASDFARAMRQLAQVTGVSFQDVIRAETKSILEAAVKKTQAAKVKLIKANVENRPVRNVGAKRYLTKAGSGFMVPSRWKKPTPNGWRLPDAIWAEVQYQIKNGIKRRKDARGLAKKSWVQAAQKLGIQIFAPAFVKKANSDGKDYAFQATGTEKHQGNNFYIEITNSRTYTASTRDAIRAAMRGRTRYFQNNLKRGVFKKTSDIAAKYPGITATA